MWVGMSLDRKKGVVVGVGRTKECRKIRLERLAKARSLPMVEI